MKATWITINTRVIGDDPVYADHVRMITQGYPLGRYEIFVFTVRPHVLCPVLLPSLIILLYCMSTMPYTQVITDHTMEKAPLVWNHRERK
jgi:hypothetical protein